MCSSSAASRLRPRLSLHKRGIIDKPLEFIGELVLGAVVLLVFIGFFIVLYNLVIGKDSTGTDAKAVADIMQRMYEDNKTYYQQETLLFTAGDNLVVGFDKYDERMTVPTQIDPIEKPDECNKGVCLCTVKKGKATNCEVIKVGDAQAVYLVMDYRGYDVQVSKKDRMLFVPPAPEPLTPPPYQGGLVNPWYYQHVAIYRSFWREKLVEDVLSTKTQTEDTEQAPQAFLPLIIEKNIHFEKQPNGSYKESLVFTLAPNSWRAQARRWYVQQCDPDHGEPQCYGLTAYESFGKVGTNKYCQPSIFKESESQRGSICKIEDLQACKENTPLFGPCVCGSQFATSGICRAGVIYDMDCRAVTKCEDYCKIGVGTDADDKCSPEEAKLCDQDTCEVQLANSCASNKDDKTCEVLLAPNEHIQ